MSVKYEWSIRVLDEAALLTLAENANDLSLSEDISQQDKQRPWQEPPRRRSQSIPCGS